ncbi:MAG: hypothetical protein WD425_21720 [Nitrospirales bacterium]
MCRISCALLLLTGKRSQDITAIAHFNRTVEWRVQVEFTIN